MQKRPIIFKAPTNRSHRIPQHLTAVAGEEDDTFHTLSPEPEDVHDSAQEERGCGEGGEGRRGQASKMPKKVSLVFEDEDPESVHESEDSESIVSCSQVRARASARVREGRVGGNEETGIIGGVREQLEEEDTEGEREGLVQVSGTSFTYTSGEESD